MPTPNPKTSHIGRSLLYSLGGVYYRVELSRLKAVVAWPTLEPSDKRGILGTLNLRGEHIPVIDLNHLVHGEPTPHNLGSRILILDCTSRGRTITVGALATEVFAMAREENSTFADRLDPCDVLSSILAGLA